MSTATAEKKTKSKLDEKDILAQLFEQVPAVTNVIKTSVVNVYENRYRINIWKGVDHPFMPKNGFIAASYFVIVEDGKVKVSSL